MVSLQNKTIYLPDIVGRGYRDFWNFRGRYRILKGSRASKKSKTTALWYIYNMMKYPGSNVLVVRKTFRSLKDSCFSDLRWAIARLDVSFLLLDTSRQIVHMDFAPNSQGIKKQIAKLFAERVNYILRVFKTICSLVPANSQ